MKHFTTITIFLGFAIIFLNCDKKEPLIKAIPQKLLPPEVLDIDKLPDSQKPSIIYLKDMPKPKYVAVPTKEGGSYINETDNQKTVVKLKPPQVISFLDEEGQPIKNRIFHGTLLAKKYSFSDGIDYEVSSNIGKLKNGKIILSNLGKTYVYDGKKFKSFTSPGLDLLNQIRGFVEDNKGNIWLASEIFGIIKYDGKSFQQFNVESGISSSTVLSVFEDSSNNLWFGTSKGISKITDNKIKNYTRAKDSVHEEKVWRIIEDNKGHIWFTTDGKGVYRYDGKDFKQFTTKDGLSSDDVFGLAMDKSGNIWFGTMGAGITIFDGNKFTKYTDHSILYSHAYLDILHDSKNRTWLGTYGDGLYLIENGQLNTLKEGKGLPDGLCQTLEEQNSNIWIGTSGGTIKIDPEMHSIFQYSYLASGSIINSNPNNMWVSSPIGLVNYTNEKMVYYNENSGLMQKNIFSGKMDLNNNVWVGTDGAGILKFDGKGFTKFDKKQGLLSNYIWHVASDLENNIWFSDNDFTTVRKITKDRLYNYASVPWLRMKSINQLVSDISNGVWICDEFDPNVYRIVNNKIYKLSIAQGLLNHTDIRLYCDNYGNIWFCSSAGINFISKSNLDKNNYKIQELKTNENFDKIIGIEIYQSKLILAEINGRIIMIDSAFNSSNSTINTNAAILNKVKIYGKETGYEFRDLCSIEVDTTNKALWVTTGQKEAGLIRLNLDVDDTKNLHPLNQEITNVTVNDKPINWLELEQYRRIKKDTSSKYATYKGIKFDSVSSWNHYPVNLVLPYDQNKISIEYNGIETSRNFMNTYQYRLKGRSNQWSDFSFSSNVSFDNLSEGDYIFMFRTKSPDGIIALPMEYNFSVLPPWWRTWWMYLIYLLTIAGALRKYISYRSKSLEDKNEQLEQKVSERTNELATSINVLKSTQAQLVQSEKMAYLGQLTAGIAHEIQNPLNFVNNFSDMSVELVDELNKEIDNGNIDVAKEIAVDISSNLSKINHHGKRAESIVKSMLQHSRSSSVKAELEQVNITSLCEEFLNLAYHGFLVKEKTFTSNYNVISHNDQLFIKIITQDISRVLLNLFQNAFYEVNEKAKKYLENYEPNVTVEISETGKNILIQVKDNAMGISEENLSKILNPFYTTKPAGQGTGLGLSLSYDIIKAHGGELSIRSTKQGSDEDLNKVRTTFEITMPM